MSSSVIFLMTNHLPHIRSLVKRHVWILQAKHLVCGHRHVHPNHRVPLPIRFVVRIGPRPRCWYS